MRKRILLSVFVLTMMTAGMCGCGKNNNQNSGSTESTGQSSTSQAESSQTQTSSQAESQPQNNYGQDTNLTAAKAAVEEVIGENYWPNMSIEAEVLEDLYGISPDMIDDFLGEMPMISANVDTLLIVKAKEDNVSAVEDALNAYRDKMVNNTTQYPMNLAKIQASRIETFGSYVCFIQLGADTTDAMDQSEEAAIAQCQEENEKAIDAIRNVLQSE